jgi:hypothetical protein
MFETLFYAACIALPVVSMLVVVALVINCTPEDLHDAGVHLDRNTRPSKAFRRSR